MDYTVHGILQARILEWVAFPFSRGTSQPRDRTQVSRMHVDSLPTKPQGKPQNTGVVSLSFLQRIFLTQESNRVSCIAGGFFTNWAIREALTNLDSILKSRDITLPAKVCLVKAMVFPNHVWIWELDYKESWVAKNWCFWTVVLEKTLESPLDCKEIQPVHPKGN